MKHINTKIFTNTDKDQFSDRLSEYLNMVNNGNTVITDVKYSTCLNANGEIEYSALVIVTYKGMF